MEEAQKEINPTLAVFMQREMAGNVFSYFLIIRQEKRNTYSYFQKKKLISFFFFIKIFLGGGCTHSNAEVSQARDQSQAMAVTTQDS